MKSRNYAVFLDLRKVYDKVNRLLVERCFVVSSPNTPGIVQLSLGEFILRTLSDVTNFEGPSQKASSNAQTSKDPPRRRRPMRKHRRTLPEGVVQCANISPPLFSTFIDPITQTLHETSHSTLQNPWNQLFADDVALFRAKPLFTRTNVFGLHLVGTFRWHAMECQ